MAEWILSSSILILLVIALRTVFKGKINLTLQYAIWALVLIRLLVPFSLGKSAISVSNLTEAAKQQPAVQAIRDIGDLNIPSKSYEQAYAEVVQQYASEGFHVEDMQDIQLEALEYEAYERMQGKNLSEVLSDTAFVIWVCGIAIVSALFLYTNLRFRKKMLRFRCALDLTKSGLPVYAADGIDTPCLFGILRPAIYVTPAVAVDATLLRHTVAHESTHYRHGDHIWSVFRCLCLVLHWYNPLVWWAAFLSQRDAELCCDAATIKKLGETERAAYGRTLIGMTCQKRTNMLITATTMTASNRSIRERIVTIARKPRMAFYTLVIVLLIVAVAVGCTFTGAMLNDPPVSETVTDTDPTETTVELPESAILYDEAAYDKVCIRVLPTDIIKSGDDSKFLIPEDQAAFLKAYQAATSAVDPEAFLEAGTEYTGWCVVYQGQLWQITQDGAMGGDGIIAAEAAAELFSLCEAAVKTAGLKAPVRPEELTGITSATLSWKGTHTVTNLQALEKLESILQRSAGSYATKCLITGRLTLELENGETKTILMATDNCAVWVSEGAYYTYSLVTEDGYTDNDELFALFGVK